MSQRKIWIGAVERWVTLGAYVRGIRAAKANPDAEFKHGLTTWWPVTGREIMRQFRASVHDRINQGIRYSERGRRQAP